jgi:cephalosporin hydroxylase
MIKDFIIENKNLIENYWESLSTELETCTGKLNTRMERKEISFHSDIKLLGFLSQILSEVEGDILEIGVWKGKSLLFMEKFSKVGKVIGIDPCEFKNQSEEILFYIEAMASKTILIQNYSELALTQLLNVSTKLKLLHIDGGHLEKNIIWDFVLYSPLITSGGYLIFDDYSDSHFSPEVKPTVDLLEKNGYFGGFNIIGIIEEYPNSFLLQKN